MNIKHFLLKTGLFLLLVGASVYALFTRADGHTDAFYLRFTSPRQKNLILGTSRTAQGLQPRVFKSVMDLDIYNYAFAISHSPYGPVYLKSIRRKLDPAAAGGIFIVTIDPWSISSRCENPNDFTQFREINLAVGNTPVVDLNPNPFYLLKNLDGKYYTLLMNTPSPMLLHTDGWLEVSPQMHPVLVRQRIETRLQKYRKRLLPVYRFSRLRWEYFIKTIRFLKQHGKVFMVRLPMHPEMMQIENELMPDFEPIIEEAHGLVAGYLDLTGYNAAFRYADGNHLHKDSGKIVSHIVAEWMKAVLRK